MLCRDVLDTLEAVEVGALAATEATAREAAQHLAGCAACQAAWPNRQQWAHRLTHAVQNVPVPVGLRERLQAACAAPATVAATAPRRSRRWWLAAVAVCAILAMGLGWWMQPLPQLTDQDLLAAMQVELGPLPKFRGPFEPQLPEAWRRYYELNPQLVRGFPQSDHPAAGMVALVPFQFQSSDRQHSIRGRLLMLRRDQFQGTIAAASFGAADIYYPTPGAFALWAEGDLVFVCLVPSGPADLHRFQQALSQSRPLT